MLMNIIKELDGSPMMEEISVKLYCKSIIDATIHKSYAPPSF